MEAINALTGEAVAPGKLEAIQQLALEQIKLEERIEKGEELLKKLKKDLMMISQTRLPDMMKEVGIESISIDGTTISVKPFYQAKIPDENQKEAMDWLRQHGHGSLIRAQFLCEYDPNSETEIEKVKQVLEVNDIPYLQKESVHPQTLKAFVREQVESGSPIPLDVFGAYVGSKTNISKA